MAAAVAVLAAGALLTGCGDQHQNASGPQKVSGDAIPAGSSSSHTWSRDGNDGADGIGADGGKDGAGASGGSDTEGPGSANGQDSGGSTSSGGAGGSGSAGGQDGSGAPGACTPSELKAAINPGHPGAGQENYSLVFTNKSGHACSVRGFPGFAFLNSAGEQVSVDPEREGGGAQTIRLTPGTSASATLSFTNPDMTGAPTVTPATALLTPPDTRSSIRVDWAGGPVSATGKESTPKISTLSPGTGS
ncbi:DUF4232 domain-containing protein [Streptomyces axinellae]|uniref:DUF4232 domain-containing protein n=1 Tax=Streptomyces axinellae TaxID=552788 RepID=UPI0031E2633F